jgi:hypothetical protein
LIIFGQGLMRAHPNLYPMLKAAQEGDEAEFRILFVRHAKDIVRYLTDSELGFPETTGFLKVSQKSLGPITGR